jgi:hypothetical protein
MTLILNSISADCIVQVSDRRLTWLDGSGRTDSKNKVVIFAPAAFAYTGLAQIGRQRTDRWLAEQLSKLPSMHVEQALNAICERATDAFSMLCLPRVHKRHAFVCTAWIAVQGLGLRPIVYIITNALDRLLRWRDKPTDEFQLFTRAFTASQMPIVIPIGDWQETPNTKQLIRQANRAARHHAPHAIRDSLTATIRHLADTRSSIGKDLLAVIFPKGDMAPFDLSGPGPMVFGLGTYEVGQLPSAEPNHVYADSALTVIGGT